MPEPVKKKVKVITAEYVKAANSIALLVECAEGRFKNQIHRSCFSYGDRTEEEIDAELVKMANILINKHIFVVFDTELDGKIKDHYSLKY